MPQLSEHSNLRLFWRSLEPSSGEIVGCLAAGFVVFGIHFLSVSLNLGNFLTTFFDGQAVAAYTNYIVGPIQQIFHSTTVNTGMVIALWGAFGLIFYTLVSFFVNLVSGWRNTEREISYGKSREIMHHPLRKTFVLYSLWRFGISIITFLTTVALQPLIRDRLLNSDKLFGVRSLTADGINIVTSILIWTIIFHGYIVLMRLYMLRTRLLGEIIY